jgi:Gamma-glutamyl cyclotransferase, AIG2-like
LPQASHPNGGIGNGIYRIDDPRGSRSEALVNVAPTRVWVFFYGTIMNPAVLRDFGVSANTTLPAKLGGYDISIRPRPTLVHSERSCVFGSLVNVTHEDLDTIYLALERNFGLKYRPEAVLATTLDGARRPALCYIASHMPNSPPDPAFIKQLAQCVRTMGLPDWYAEHVEALGASGAGDT